jgi:hypothetical protein
MPSPPAAEVSAEAELVQEFYRRRGLTAAPGPRDLEQAQALLREHGLEKAHAVVPLLVQVVQKEWPECRSFSGAVQKYLADALKAQAHEQHRQACRNEDLARRQQEQQEQARQRAEQQQFRAAWEPLWQGLSEEEREAIRQGVLARHPHLSGTRHLLEEQCLRELARRVSVPCAERGLPSGSLDKAQARH